MSEDVCFEPAEQLAGRIRSREISAREVMQAFLTQIDRVNPKVNAIVTRISDDEALALADEADARLASGDDVGPLHGLPIAHKDLEPTAGMRTTFGSPLHKDFVPDQDSALVERLRKAGALRIGKTNTPEFGAGSHTFNPVFGATHNPWDLTKTCGGSSGGAAVALACGMLPIADGSDHGGSLRNPGNFNNIVGFRPSAGRVPVWPTTLGWYPLSVKGPMARSVPDVAFLLAAMAGPDLRSPISLNEPGEQFLAPLDIHTSKVRIAWSPDLGGLPVDRRVSAVLEKSVGVFEDLGCQVEEATPDFSDVEEAYQILRAWTFATGREELYRNHRDQLKQTVIWNIEEGLVLTGMQVGWAEAKRTEVYHRMRQFFERYDYLICPVNQVPPFDIEIEYPTKIEGVHMENYISWMASAYWISFTGLPAISVPAGFTDDDPPLPVGLQIVGPYRDDFSVLQIAHAFEQATNYAQRRPPVVENAANTAT